MIIGHFVFRRRWLSNFHHCHVEYKGHVYHSVEHGYQAQKAGSKANHDWIARAQGAAEARRRGRSIERRPGFDSFKERLMLKLLWSKFYHNPNLRRKLIATWPHELVHGNTHGDEFWGVNRRTGKGEDKLGKLLMYLRDCVREGIDHRIPQMGAKKRERHQRWRERYKARLEDANLGAVVRPLPPIDNETAMRYYPSLVKRVAKRKATKYRPGPKFIRTKLCPKCGSMNTEAQIVDGVTVDRRCLDCEWYWL